MPKKINALREKLLMCAREILVGRGYSELTIRAIATECGCDVTRSVSKM